MKCVEYRVGPEHATPVELTESPGALGVTRSQQVKELLHSILSLQNEAHAGVGGQIAKVFLKQFWFLKSIS